MVQALRGSVFLGFLFCLLGLIPQALGSSPPTSQITLPDGKSLKTQLYAPEVIAAFRDKGPNPIWLVSAQTCLKCAMDERFLFLLNSTGAHTHQLLYPGKVQDPKTGNAWVESRAFWGSCLPDQAPGYAILQRELIDKRKRGRVSRVTEFSLFVLEVKEDRIQERLIEVKSQKQYNTYAKNLQAAAKRGGCAEIAGRNRKAASSPYDIQNKKFSQELEDDDDSE